MAPSTRPTHALWEFIGRGEKAAENIFEEIMASNLPNLIKDVNLYSYIM